MTQHLSLDVDPDPNQPVRTVGDLCRRVTDTSGLPHQASVVFTLARDRLRAVGVELAL
jgi:hypothetical protein